MNCKGNPYEHIFAQKCAYFMQLSFIFINLISFIFRKLNSFIFTNLIYFHFI